MAKANSNHDRVMVIYTKVQAVPFRERLQGVEEWLRAGYPTTYPVLVRVEKIAPIDGYPCWGECYMGTLRRLRIRVDKNQDTHRGVETLIHEWAHAMTWPTAHAERHPKAERVHPLHGTTYWAAYGKIYEAYYDGIGWKVSAGFR